MYPLGDALRKPCGDVVIPPIAVWANGTWHFMGAAEPSPQGLDHAWFYPFPVNTSIPGGTMNSVFATSWEPTQSGLHFPLYWDLSIKWVHADDVTRYYTVQPRLPYPASLGLRNSAAL